MDKSVLESVIRTVTGNIRHHTKVETVVIDMTSKTLQALNEAGKLDRISESALASAAQSVAMAAFNSGELDETAFRKKMGEAVENASATSLAARIAAENAITSGGGGRVIGSGGRPVRRIRYNGDVPKIGDNYGGSD